LPLMTLYRRRRSPSRPPRRTNTKDVTALRRQVVMWCEGTMPTSTWARTALPTASGTYVLPPPLLPGVGRRVCDSRTDHDSSTYGVPVNSRPTISHRAVNFATRCLQLSIRGRNNSAPWSGGRPRPPTNTSHGPASNREPEHNAQWFFEHHPSARTSFEVLNTLGPPVRGRKVLANWNISVGIQWHAR